MKTIDKRHTLKRNIINLLVLGWVVPVLIMTTLLILFIDSRYTAQIEETVTSSMNKAQEIFALELKVCETASKNASYYSNIRSAYLDHKEKGNIRNLRNEVETFLNAEYKYNQIIKSAELSMINEDLLFYTYNNSAGASYKNVSIYKERAVNDVLKASKEIGTRMKLLAIDGNTYLVRNLMLPNFTPFAVLSLEVNEEDLLEGYKSVWGYDGVAVTIDSTYMAGDREILDEAKLFAKDIKNGPVDLESVGTRFYKGKDCSFALLSFNKYDENIVAVVRLNNGMLFQNVYAIWIVFLIIVAALIPLSIMIFVFIRQDVTRPVDSMVKAYEEISNKNYGFKIESKASTKEMAYMQESFNDMSVQIKEQFEKIYSEEILLRDARIMALQSQINPHFLNNTFEIINWEARLNGNIKVSKMIEALSTMLEATMHRDGNTFHLCAKEIEYVDAYAYIISERLGEKFKYTKEIDESLLDVMLPKLIIQPIIENAVEHGLDAVSSGNVTLRIYREGEYVLIDVINDGIMSDKDMKKIEKLLNPEIDSDEKRSLSLGIRNVNNRIKLIYGDDCGLYMSNMGEKYTLSRIRIKNNNWQNLAKETI